MNILKLKIPEVVLFEPNVFEDNRGFFFESFNEKGFQKELGLSQEFVQDNHSKSKKGVLRGLHYQEFPYAQGKIVRVVQGEVFDVAVDIRLGSPTFGQWVGEILSETNKRMLWIPEGFAHGFYTLSDTAVFLYKTTGYYAPGSEKTILWNDPSLNINWKNEEEPIVSGKDKQGMFLEQLFD